MHITDLEKVLLRSKEQNAVSKRNTLALQNKLALSEQTFINNAALSSATSSFHMHQSEIMLNRSIENTLLFIVKQ